ncbi:MAG: hypothetical protein IIV82_02110 [Ruminococcus sp.]|nr:hypothetical protein [Ruminococcus sp.]
MKKSQQIKWIKKHLPKVLSAAMTMTILCCTVGVTAYSAGVEKNAPAAAAAATETAPKAKTADAAADSKRFSKEETVYVIAGADGTPQKVIVSDWIKNPQKAKTIADKSDLKDIENTKGDETYTINEKKLVEWGADGNDIYYKGTSSRQLPVGVSIRYELDGAPIAPKDLGGKSGRLKMTFSYTNRQSEEVTINGKKEKIYVPFVMLTGMMLDNEKAGNVTVSNGKVINDGSRTYVAGFALPGMQESLGLDKDKIKLPDTVEVTADVRDFELATTLTVAANQVFNDIDTAKLDKKTDELKKKLGELTDGVNKLADGTSQLYSGLSTLLDKSGELIDGVKELYSGAEQLKDGSAALAKGAGDLSDGAEKLDGGVAALQSGAGKLQSGAGDLAGGAGQLDDGVATLQGYIGTLAGGLSQISANSSTLVSGARQVFQTLLAEADKQIAAAGLSADSLTIDGYADTLNALTEQLSDENAQKLAYQTAYKTVSATVNSQRGVIRQAVEAQVKKQVTDGVLAAAGLGLDSDSYDAAVAAGQVSEEVQMQVSGAIASQMAGLDETIDAETDAQAAALIETNMQSDEVQAQIAEGVQKAAGGRQSLQALKAQLDSYSGFYYGVISYTDGVNQANAGAQEILGGTVSLKDGAQSLADGAGQLKGGTKELKSGADTLKAGSAQLKDGADALHSGAVTLDGGMLQLYNGIGTLNSGAGALLDGMTQLENGAQQLDTGMQKLKKEGVDALVKAADGDLTSLADRAKAMIRASKKYQSFSGLGDNTDGKVDFIFKTDAVKKEK